MINVCIELEDWFKQRPLWLQEGCRRIIQNGAIRSDDIDDIVAICKAETEIGNVPDLNQKDIGFSSISSVCSIERQPIILEQIIDIKGVNALSPKKPIVFNNSLNVIYGKNGAGKSGYVRLLKHICGAKNPGILYGNVFKGQNTEPSCIIQSKIDGKSEVFNWSFNDGKIDKLKGVEIYDTQGAHVYINDENEVTYEPYILSVFRELTILCDKLKTLFQSEIDRLPSRKPSIPSQLAKTRSGEWYDGITYKTKQDEIDQKCKWDETDEDRLVNLNKRLTENNPAEKAASFRRKKEHAISLIKNLNEYYELISDDACKSYFEAKLDFESKKKTANEDAIKIFENTPIKGIGSESWHRLWEAARDFSLNVVYPENVFPNLEEGARCVLCHQPIEKNAKIRLESFEKYVKKGVKKID